MLFGILQMRKTYFVKMSHDPKYRESPAVFADTEVDFETVRQAHMSVTLAKRNQRVASSNQLGPQFRLGTRLNPSTTCQCLLGIP